MANSVLNIEKLLVYQESKKLRLTIFELVKTFPSDEKFRLTDQIIRSTRMCPANIAEGYGRFHFQENIQYCRIARGSLVETLDHLSVALECKYITDEHYKILVDQVTKIIKMINGYINHLREKKKST